MNNNAASRASANANPPGVPAIRPRIATDDPTQAAFTEEDVRQLLAAHPLFLTTDGSTPVIAKVLFLPASQVSRLLKGETIGRPPTTLVCYVEVQGKLSMANAHSPFIKGRPYTPRTAHVGHVVFEAQTGNLLLWGFAGSGVPANPRQPVQHSGDVDHACA